MVLSQRSCPAPCLGLLQDYLFSIAVINITAKQQHGEKRTCFSLQLANQQENKPWETLKAETWRQELRLSHKGTCLLAGSLWFAQLATQDHHLEVAPCPVGWALPQPCFQAI